METLAEEEEAYMRALKRARLDEEAATSSMTSYDVDIRIDVARIIYSDDPVNCSDTPPSPRYSESNSESSDSAVPADKPNDLVPNPARFLVVVYSCVLRL